MVVNESMFAEGEGILDRFSFYKSYDSNSEYSSATASHSKLEGMREGLLEKGSYDETVRRSNAKGFWEFFQGFLYLALSQNPIALAYVVGSG